MSPFEQNTWIVKTPFEHADLSNRTEVVSFLRWFWRWEGGKQTERGERAYIPPGYSGARVQQTRLPRCIQARDSVKSPVTRSQEKWRDEHISKIMKGWKHLNCLTTSSPAPHHPSKPATASPNPRKRSTHMLASILQCPHTPEALTNTPKPTAQNPSLAQTAA